MGTIELRPHQTKAVDELHNGCILNGGVGTGKTITSLAYYWTKVMGGVLNDLGSLRKPLDLYVITTARKRDDLDWEEEAANFGISSRRESSVEGLAVTVDSWQNVQKYSNVENAMFIFDEKKLEGTGAWSKAFQKIVQKNQWIVLTATPGDTWLDYAQVFIANGWYKNITDFKRTHVVYNTFSKFPKVDRYVEVGRLVRYRNQILVDMPYERHTKRHLIDTLCDYDRDIFERVLKKRWHVYEERPLKDVGELFRVMRKVVNTDSSRIRKVESLMEKHPKMIVFYNFDYELEILRGLKDFDTSSGLITNELSRKRLERFSIAEWNGHKHEPIPTTDSWIYLVQYVAGAEAWNCIDTNAVVFYSLNYSYKLFEQCQGRIDRMNTPFINLYYYVFKSDSAIDRSIWKALRMKKTFNEKEIGSKMRVAA